MMKEEGKSIDEIAAWLEENKLHVVHNFTVDDLSIFTVADVYPKPLL